MKKNIIVTAFVPFNNEKTNSSLEMSKRLSLYPNNVRILSVSYSKVEEEINKIIKNDDPDVVLCLGQAKGDNRLRVEKLAINYMKANIEDNDGVKMSGTKICDDTDAIFTGINIEDIVTKLEESKIPAYLSLSAGSFVCNCTYFHFLRKMNKNCLFVHLPLLSKENERFILEGIEKIIAYLNEN